MRSDMNEHIEKMVEELRPRVRILPHQAVQWENARHILQSGLDEWYKDFVPHLRTALTSYGDTRFNEGLGRAKEVFALSDFVVGRREGSSFKEYTWDEILAAIEKEKI